MSESRSLSRATLGALGVVYGDIGTSPLYALREATAAAGGVTGAAAVLGVVSLIFWSLLLVISIKYVVLILRADNDGEGGILSLVALVQRRIGTAGTWARPGASGSSSRRRGTSRSKRPRWTRIGCCPSPWRPAPRTCSARRASSP